MILEHHNFNCSPENKILYEDEVVWGAHFSQMRHTLPFDKVPVFSLIKDVQPTEASSEENQPLIIAQSGSIARLASNLVKNRSAQPISDPCFLNDPYWDAYNDSIFELGQEMCSINPIINCYAGVQFERMATWYYQEQLPKFLHYLERQLVSVVIPRVKAGLDTSAAAKNLDEEVFWGGLGCPSFADFQIFHYLDNAETGLPGCILDTGKGSLKVPEVREWFLRMRNLPSMRKYLEDRPKLIGIGTNPGLEDRQGRVIRQREGLGHCWLKNGIFLDTICVSNNQGELVN